MLMLLGKQSRNNYVTIAVWELFSEL